MKKQFTIAAVVVALLGAGAFAQAGPGRTTNETGVVAGVVRLVGEAPAPGTTTSAANRQSPKSWSSAPTTAFSGPSCACSAWKEKRRRSPSRCKWTSADVGSYRMSR